MISGRKTSQEPSESSQILWSVWPPVLSACKLSWNDCHKISFRRIVAKKNWQFSSKFLEQSSLELMIPTISKEFFPAAVKFHFNLGAIVRNSDRFVMRLSFNETAYWKIHLEPTKLYFVQVTMVKHSHLKQNWLRKKLDFWGCWLLWEFWNKCTKNALMFYHHWSMRIHIFVLA
jgi:hypothetical protein